METRCRNKNVLTVFLKFNAVLLLYIFSLVAVQAQLRVVPYAAKEHPVEFNAARVSSALSLPFFDDFSTVKGPGPDLAFWMPGSGVYVNNNLTNNHPSVNIATFDGLDALGKAYTLTNPMSRNYTDSLTSRPINLSAKAVKDSVYLSFYWLAKGLGERPDSVDFLKLDALDRSGNWVEVWKQQGDVLDEQYKQVLIKLTNQAFFHAGFQFRFSAYGRNTGMYDMWHIDYVYLNANRNVNDKYTLDLTVRNPPTSFLKGYSAMPLIHYRIDPAKATNETLSIDVVNRNNSINKFTYTMLVRDEISKTIYQNKPAVSVDIRALEEKNIAIPIAPVSVNGALKKINLQYKFSMSTTDHQNKMGDLRRNDSISGRVQLDDYYAFDDGSAEYGVQITQKLGRAAVRYAMAKPEEIAGVRVAYVPFDTDVTGQSFVIQLYSEKNGLPDQLIKQQAFAVKDVAVRNGFVEYKFQSAVAVPATFYVGWLQLNDIPITVGLDRNSFENGRVFSSMANSWSVEDAIKGNVMIRPFLGSGGEGINVGLEPVEVVESIFYPNPSTGIVHWKREGLKKIDVISVDGKILRTLVPKTGQVSSQLDLPDGTYMLKWTDGKQINTQKVVIVK